MMTAVGLLAAMLTTCSWLPQLRRSWETRSTEDISWLYLGAFGIGVALWLVYGVLGRDLAITLANAFTAAMVLFLVGMKARFDHLDVRRAAQLVEVSSRPATDG